MQNDRATTASGVQPPSADTQLAPDELRIVVPIDFSQSSLRALQWAESIASGRRAVVTVVHAIEPTPLSVTGDAAESLVVRAEDRIRTASAALAAHGIVVVPHCAVGRPWQVVRDAVEQHGADLVLLGNRGLSPIKRTILGSNADRVLRTVASPALVVRAADMPRGHLRVLVATDFSADAAEAILDFRRVFLQSLVRLEVRVVHATIPPGMIESVDMPLIERVDWSRIDSNAHELAEQVAREFRSAGVETSVVVRRGTAARTILSEARDWHADLIVLGRRGMSGFERMILGSTAERVLHAASCAVFTAQCATVASTPSPSSSQRAAIIS
jgi:nucleotide-binding universal stress UspA family protein